MNTDTVANLLDKIANYIDAVEFQTQSELQQQRESLVDGVCDKFAEATGEEVSPELRKKLAAADESIISIVERMAATNTAEKLGAPSSRPGHGAPATIKEASQAADDRFVSWVLNG